MKFEDYLKAKELYDELSSVLLEEEALRGIIKRLDSGDCSLSFDNVRISIDKELVPVIRDHYQKKLAANIAKRDRLKELFEKL